MLTSNDRLIIKILKISCFVLFFGRAWQFLFWDAPLRALLWDQELLEGLITTVFDINWEEYVTSSTVDLLIQGVIKATGVFYLLMAIFSLFIKDQIKIGKHLLMIASASFAFLAFLYCKEKFFHIGQFFEYSIQILTPTLLLIAIYYPAELAKNRFQLSIKIAIALTFICHGLYAYGFYPRPGVFIDMTIGSLKISENSAHELMYVAGILDFIAAAGIFLKRNSLIFITYCVVWGTVTALARTWGNLNFDSNQLAIIHQYLPQTLYRLPHGLIPLVLLIIHYPRLFSAKGKFENLVSEKAKTIS
ncbi:MAG: hypothetical protein AAFQ94_08105 [Bacteroidota bacterium]